ncbi:MAG: acetyl-CoA carboxylase biotin carboxylase subunit [Dehalococcoidia bacterium]|nr:acetyl-CoA carboxylase biotin carboxylase subunit [Dehalococcoidia bacterium]
MFKRVLLANRGEIALRIQRACRELGIETVAVYSDADRDSLHVRNADVAVNIGPGPATESYLLIDRIIEVARATGADAIHPGYGFLSENPRFVDAVEAAGITFIGPPASAMRALGDKVSARKLMEAAGVPVVPGANDIDPTDLARATSEAKRVGFPLLVKAAAGGGGRGIRQVDRIEDLEAAMRASGSEAASSFGDATIFLERYVSPARHIEVQLIADNYGNVRAYGERECSVQRRHQKLLEEAPSVAVTPELRARLCAAAVAAAKSCGYRNAGTVEFLLDASGKFYFLEVNARLQVEHPISELVYGVDLVAQQLAVASGERIPDFDTEGPLTPRGWAIEARINGEDPYRNFAPSLGKVEHFEAPLGPGVRFDSMLFEGLDVPIYYDSMLGKLIVWGADRPEAIRRMRRALTDLVIAGPQTNIPFQLALLDNADFIAGDVHTAWLESSFTMPPLPDPDPRLQRALIAAALTAELGRASASNAPWSGDAPGGAASTWTRTSRQQALNLRTAATGARGWQGTAS